MGPRRKKGCSGRDSRRAHEFRIARLHNTHNNQNLQSTRLCYDEIISGMRRQANTTAQTRMEGTFKDAYDSDMEPVVIRRKEEEQQRWHVPRLGNMMKMRPNGVFRLLGGQLNGSASRIIRDRRIADLTRLIDTWDIQVGGFSEVGINWTRLPRMKQLCSWFRATQEEVRTSTSHNTNENVELWQPGGIRLFACKELRQYIHSSSSDTRQLGRWNSWLIHTDSNHRTRMVVAYQLVEQEKSGLQIIYQKHKRYIMEKGLSHSPRDLFQRDLLRALSEWRKQGDCIALFIDMNEHALTGTLAAKLRGMGLVEATH